MLRVQVTSDDGVVRKYASVRPSLTLGRAADCDIVLDAPGISTHHVRFSVMGSRVSVEDLRSTNGTWIDDVRLQTTQVLLAGQCVRVPGFRVAVTLEGAASHSLSHASHASSGAPPPASFDPRASLLDATSLHAAGVADTLARVGVADTLARATPSMLEAVGLSGAARAWRDGYLRCERYAKTWDQQGRPNRLLLRKHELGAARAWLATASPEHQPPVTALMHEFIRESGEATRTRARRRLWGWMAAATLVTTGLIIASLWWNRLPPTPDAAPTKAKTATPPPRTNAPTPAAPKPLGPPAWIEHTVIPAETLEDVASRYDVPINNLARWNKLNPDKPSIVVGQKLRVKPKRRPLPQQRISYEIERGESWRRISQRFDVPIENLRLYNPEIGGKLVPGQTITVWIDPKVQRSENYGKPIPSFDVRPDAVSVGSPNDGWLENGIQFPPSGLYERRNAREMWGSSHTIKHLQIGLARFRQDMNFEGTVVVADLSLERGGPFRPHMSHQNGRDVDIWLPSLKGVYKKSHLGTERRPEPDEADWFATWGLVRALISTGEVQSIFLLYDLQERVHQAAVLMGATEEELERSMQWPRGPRSSGILAHSDGHIHHVHVRFRCGPADVQCRNSVVRE